MKNKLTGKCKEEFYNWYEENAHISKFNKTRNVSIVHFIAQSETCQNALIIEWLDSVGIYVSIHYETFGSHYFNVMVTRNHLTTNLRTYVKTRTEATNAALTKANEIFNLNNK